MGILSFLSGTLCAAFWTVSAREAYKAEGGDTPGNKWNLVAGILAIFQMFFILLGAAIVERRVTGRAYTVIVGAVGAVLVWIIGTAAMDATVAAAYWNNTLKIPA